jgi:hypothetical protein
MASAEGLHGVLRRTVCKPDRHATKGYRLVETPEKRTGEFLQANTGLWFCDGCLALKIGASLQAMRDVMTALTRFSSYRVGDHRCSLCQRVKGVIRAVADSPRRRTARGTLPAHKSTVNHPTHRTRSR